MSPGLRFSLFQMAVFIAGGVSTAFLPLWLAQCGLTPAAVGQVLGLAAMLRLGAVPLWGRLADGIGRVRPVLILSAAITTVGSLAFLPAYGFVGVLAVAVLQGFACSALLPLCDTLCLALAREGRLDYGRIRAIGSAAFTAATALAGPVVGAAGPISVPLLMAGFYGLSAWLGTLLPATRAPPVAALTAGTARLLRNRAFLLTIAASALIQSSNGAYYALATLHWRGHGLSDTVIGLLWAEGVLAETILFVFARRLGAAFGPAGLTAMAGGGALLRWSVTAFTTDPWLLAAVQLLHAASYAMQHLSAMLMLTRYVQPGRAATAQAVHSAIGLGAPTGLMMWLSGALYGGGGGVFLLMAALGAGGLALAPALRRPVRDQP